MLNMGKNKASSFTNFMILLSGFKLKDIVYESWALYPMLY